MALTKPEITELTVAEAPDKLFHEWLALYFDGGSHTVGGVTATFPKVNRAFGQGAPTQPFKDVLDEIRLVILPREQEVDSVAPGQNLVTDQVMLQFWVSAKAGGPGQSESLARDIAQKLKALLSNPDTRYALAQKGVTHIHQVRVSGPVAGKDYHKRLVSCAAGLQFTINFGDLLAESPYTPAQFVNEEVLVAGNYLVGTGQWGYAARLLGGVVTYRPPQNSPVTLGLEVAGTLTDTVLTLPVGAPLADARLEFTLSRTVAADQIVRWQVLTAPAPEDSAWHLGLTLRVQPQ